MHLIELLCRRVRWTSEQMEDSSLLAAPARLAKRLVSLARSHGRATPAGAELKMSQEELAQFLGLSRQIVNKHLQTWKRKEWITLARGRRRDHERSARCATSHTRTDPDVHLRAMSCG